MMGISKGKSLKSKDPPSVRPLIHTCKMVQHLMTGECTILLSLATNFPKIKARILEFGNVRV